MAILLNLVKKIILIIVYIKSYATDLNDLYFRFFFTTSVNNCHVFLMIYHILKGKTYF